MEKTLILVGSIDHDNFLFYGEDDSYESSIYQYSISNDSMWLLSDYSIEMDDSFDGLSLVVTRNGNFYSKFYLNDPFDYGYQKIYFNREGKDHFLDSIYNADKIIHSSFSFDGKFLLVNTLNTLSDYYNPEQDNRIMIYDLSAIELGTIKKNYIPCSLCSDSFMVGDQLFFTIGRKDGYDGYSNKDIYKAPFNDISDTTKIAVNTDLIGVSPDGNYILGSRFLDRQKTTAVIIEVSSRKYQMLLGRDYPSGRPFYSLYENKFAFSIKGHIIYIDFPESYPFDALTWRNEEIPDWTETEFWSQFEHPPFPEK